jgi:phage terminase Nu1 subunit (DNA packaging protein)
MKVKGIQRIAEFFEVHPRSVRNWRTQGAPISKHYEADLSEVQLWRAKFKRGGGGERQNFLSPQKGLDFEATRLKKAQADRTEMANAEKRGELVHIKEIGPWIVFHALEVKTRFLEFERSLPPFLENQDARSIATILRGKIREVLCRLADAPSVLDKGEQAKIIETINFLLENDLDPIQRAIQNLKGENHVDGKGEGPADGIDGSPGG